MPNDRRDQLRAIRTFPSLIRYLRDELDWPIQSEDFEDLTFDYTAEELGIDQANAAKIQEIKRLRPLVANQPWGVFFVEFEPKRLPVVALRRILNGVVMKKRASANAADRVAWQLDDLLFISSYGEEGGEGRQISFAHFTHDPADTQLPTLKVLGWDSLDTPLHLDHVDETLRARLRWPENEEDADSWREEWQGAFTLRHREVITTSKVLAVELARLARAIRDRIRGALAIETEAGPIRALLKAFREALIHDLSAEDFADMYAQTIAYGLLSARITRAPEAGQSHPGLQLPVTNPFLKELMETFLHIGTSRTRTGGRRHIDFDELGVGDVAELLDAADMEAVVRDFGDRNPQEDPVIHFYESFLKEYDAKKRMQRGVFYTPRPVVSFIVRSVDELLRTEFGLEDGLADTVTWGEMAQRRKDLRVPEGATLSDPFVTIIDPASGTGTFLVEAIDAIHETMVSKWQAEGHTDEQVADRWNAYVPRYLLPRLHGFELLMAPYAIAHLKVGLKLHETGYRFTSDERARIYLTNSLEPPQDFSDRFESMLPALAHEAQAVNRVKGAQRFTVVIGNPPYSNFGRLNRNPFILALLDDYKRDLGEKKLNLDDDFIKFLRLSQWILDTSGAGVLGLVTNNTYLDGITHRQMRAVLRSSLADILVLDLHGSAAKRETCPDGSPDANVFDIRQGVSISFWVKSAKGVSLASVHHADLWGLRESKYNYLTDHSRGSVPFRRLYPGDPYHFFVPKDFARSDEYARYPGLSEIFVVNGPGVKTERDVVSIHWTKQQAEEAVEAFRVLRGGVGWVPGHSAGSCCQTWGEE